MTKASATTRPPCLARLEAGTQVYACGPLRMLQALETHCAHWPDDARQVEHVESTLSTLDPALGHAFEVELKAAQTSAVSSGRPGYCCDNAKVPTAVAAHAPDAASIIETRAKAIDFPSRTTSACATTSEFLTPRRYVTCRSTVAASLRLPAADQSAKSIAVSANAAKA